MWATMIQVINFTDPLPWEEVLAAARNEKRPQPMYYLAAVIAEQRGDSVLAVRLYKQALDPRFTTGPWFTMAWRALQRLGHDPAAFLRRNVLPATRSARPSPFAAEQALENGGVFGTKLEAPPSTCSRT